MAAFPAGLSDAKQIGRNAREDGPKPRPVVARRLRHGYKLVRMISEAYDAETTEAWLFGTNTRWTTGHQSSCCAPRKALEQFTAPIRAARQLASFQT
jgi:hypothetical protein